MSRRPCSWRTKRFSRWAIECFPVNPADKIQKDLVVGKREIFLAPNFKGLWLNASNFEKFGPNPLSVLLEEGTEINRRKRTGIEPPHHASVMWDEYFATVSWPYIFATTEIAFSRDQFCVPIRKMTRHREKFPRLYHNNIVTVVALQLQDKFLAAAQVATPHSRKLWKFHEIDSQLELVSIKNLNYIYRFMFISKKSFRFFRLRLIRTSFSTTNFRRAEAPPWTTSSKSCGKRTSECRNALPGCFRPDCWLKMSLTLEHLTQAWTSPKRSNLSKSTRGRILTTLFFQAMFRVL